MEASCWNASKLECEQTHVDSSSIRQLFDEELCYPCIASWNILGRSCKLSPVWSKHRHWMPFMHAGYSDCPCQSSNSIIGLQVSHFPAASNACVWDRRRWGGDSYYDAREASVLPRWSQNGQNAIISKPRQSRWDQEVWYKTTCWSCSSTRTISFFVWLWIDIIGGVILIHCVASCVSDGNTF